MSILTLSNVNVLHSGNYFCYGSVALSNRHFIDRVTIWVIGEPFIQIKLLLQSFKTILDNNLMKPKAVRVMEMSEANFSCMFGCDQVRWYRYGNDEVLAYGPLLHLWKLKLTHQGTYVCECRGTEGFLSRSKGQLEVIGTCSTQ